MVFLVIDAQANIIVNLKNATTFSLDSVEIIYNRK